MLASFRKHDQQQQSDSRKSRLTSIISAAGLIGATTSRAGTSAGFGEESFRLRVVVSCSSSVTGSAVLTRWLGLAGQKRLTTVARAMRARCLKPVAEWVITGIEQSARDLEAKAVGNGMA
jgi:hypothetical protein